MPWIKEGCITCKTCIKNCPVSAIDIIANSAKIDNSACTDCGRCILVCPIEIIRPNYEKNKNREQKWFDE